MVPKTNGTGNRGGRSALSCFITQIFTTDLSQLSTYSKEEITSEQISACPTSPWTVCQAGATLQEATKDSNEDLTDKAALMHEPTLQVVIVVTSQCPACVMRSQVVYTCSAGLWAVKVRYLELVVIWTLVEFRQMQLKREEKTSVSPEYPIPTRSKRKHKVCVVTQAGLCLIPFPLLVPKPIGIVRSPILVSHSRLSLS